MVLCFSHNLAFQCESCQVEKHTHHTYGPRVNKTGSSPFDLVHSDRRSTFGYFVLIKGSLMSWRSKKQNISARSSAKAECRAMAASTCELI